MPTVLHKTVPLAEQWAQRNNATEVSLIPLTQTDIAYSNGQIVEFDEQLDYIDETARRHKKNGANAWESSKPSAQGECNLINAACSSLERGRLAEQRLRGLGYIISDDTFTTVRASHALDRTRVYEDAD